MLETTSKSRHHCMKDVHFWSTGGCLSFDNKTTFQRYPNMYFKRVVRVSDVTKNTLFGCSFKRVLLRLLDIAEPILDVT